VHRRLVRLLDTAELVEQVGRVRLYHSDRIAGPVSFGLIAPVVILPDAHILPLSPAERALAVRHELAHHARGDLWANGCAVLLAALHWFNPLTRAAWRAFRFDQEAACDATVLCRAEQGSRGVYARALAKAASGQASAFASPMVRQDRLKDRLAMLAHPDPSRARRRLGLIAACVALLAGLGITATPVLADPPDAPLPPEPLRVDGAVAVQSHQDASGHVVQLRRADGSTVVLRADHPLSQVEVGRMVAQADASRSEAQQAAADAGREADQAWRDAQQARDEALREADQARAEALRDAAQARAEALADAAHDRAEALREAREARAEALRDARQARTEALAAAAEARGAAWRGQRRAAPPAPPAPPPAAARPAPPATPVAVTRIRLRAGTGQGEIIVATGAGRTSDDTASITPAVLMCDGAGAASADACVDGDALQLQLISLRRQRDAVVHTRSSDPRDTAARSRALSQISRQIAALEAALRG
jgi:hypothetical protein